MPDNIMKERLNRTLAAAKWNYEQNPTLANTVWYGRVLGFRYQYDDAIKVFSAGLETCPDSFELFRQRGHRFISIRQFQAALMDLQKAARLIEGMPLWIEPDGADNELTIPPASIQFNTYYHLGLAHYMLRNWNEAAEAFRTCHEWITLDDYNSLTACIDWHYMTLRRSSRITEAQKLLDQVPPDLQDDQFIEGPMYYRRIQMYRGELAPESLLHPDRGNQEIHSLDTIYATQGYGVGNWYLYHGDIPRAKEIFERIMKIRSTSAFGYIAAERDLEEMKSVEGS
jgi:tetratricopeptide (TPR) repeat protein